MVGVAPSPHLGDDGKVLVAFALFDDLEAADDVAAELARADPGERAIATTIHRDAFDDLNVPEGAMQIGRLVYMALGTGAGVGLVGGLIAGGLFSIPGLGAGMGAALGLVSGLLLGALCALMAGARSLKPEVARIANSLDRGKALVVAQVEESQLERVELAFERGGALEFDSV